MAASSNDPHVQAGQVEPGPGLIGATELAEYDWEQVEQALGAEGHHVLPGVLPVGVCKQLRALYGEPGLFRARIQMERHAYGKGQYQYFSYPLPVGLGALRADFYRYLAPIANRWQQALGGEAGFPAGHAAFIEQCQLAGQCRPTPLLLEYREGDYNCLHQDLYGDIVFPLQVAVLLSEPGTEFRGGEFVLTEQRPRMQSRPMVVPLACGDAVVFAVRERPVQGTRGAYRVQMRHGVSRLRAGQRYTLGLIFHDAK